MKTHIKLYKVKKKWVTVLVVSGITMSLGLGIGIVNQTTDVSAITIDPVNKKLTQNKAVVQSVPMDTANTQIKNILLANDGTDETWSPSLPTQSGLYGDYANSYANATIVNQNGKDYSIDYRIGPTTGQGTKYANYNKISYSSEFKAIHAINDSLAGTGAGDYYNDKGEPVNLGYGTTGKKENYKNSVEWVQQNYYITANNKDSNYNLAKEVVKKLSSEELPKINQEEGAPFFNGIINLDPDATSKANSLEQTFMVRQGTDVYTLNAHDPQTLIDMAISLRYI